LRKTARGVWTQRNEGMHGKMAVVDLGIQAFGMDCS
jgi:hypothetical protein